MKLISFLFFGLCLSIVSTSCNNQIKTERLARIDSLGIHLNYVEETLGQIDSVMISNRIAEIDQTGMWVVDNITDTLHSQKGIAFGDYIRTKKYLVQAASRYREVGDELRLGKKQIETLRKDIKNNFYSEEEFRGYFKTESESIASLVKATDELKSKYEISDSRFLKYKPAAMQIVDSIKKVIYGSEPVSK